MGAAFTLGAVAGILAAALADWLLSWVWLFSVGRKRAREAGR